MPDRPAIAVIGAGASGLLTAIQLLTQSGRGGPRIYLIEKSDVFGAGAAYSTNDPAHILNTRVINMSAFPDKPNHFLDWVGKTGACGPEMPTPSCFVSRHTYGQYLRALLRDAAISGDAAGRFYLVADEAVSLIRDGAGGFVIRTAIGKDRPVQAAVIATGNPPPHPPGVEDDGVLTSSYYVGDPWAAIAAASAPAKNSAVLLLGTGLTMVDFAIALTRDGHTGPIIALSRRGLLPRPHGLPARQPLPPPPRLSSNIVTDLASLRRTIADEAARGRDWRDVIDALRPGTTAYWRSLPLSDRQRFLRHLRPWWDVHRHRLASEVAAQLQNLLQKGALEIRMGRLKALSLSKGAQEPVTVTWTPRASQTRVQFQVSQIINCTGPGNNPALSPFPIIRQMLADGLVRPDALGLGIAVDSASRVIADAGFADRRLFAVGPATRGTFWEVTAVPDIRVQAANVAREVLAVLERTACIRPDRVSAARAVFD
jgi:uncharacterized NAD(P)/FAD-binding protein YdhS